MIKIKRIVLVCLSLGMCCNSLTFVRAFDNKSDMQPNKESIDSFQVENDTLAEMKDLYDIPEEVSEYISDVLNTNKNAKIIVDSPESKATPFASSGSWSSTRTYKGYTLKDWKVHVTNSFNMTNIKNGSTSAKFANELLIYGGGSLLDKFVPFGSAGISLIQFITGNSSITYASSGDKASAAPKYTSDTKFTYVKVGTDYLLGARTHSAKLEDITWFYYSDSKHTTINKKKVYNKTSRTSLYNSPDSKAITSTGIGGYLQNPIDIRIGDRTFVLQ